MAAEHDDHGRRLQRVGHDEPPPDAQRAAGDGGRHEDQDERRSERAPQSFRRGCSHFPRAVIQNDRMMSLTSSQRLCFLI